MLQRPSREVLTVSPWDFPENRYFLEATPAIPGNPPLSSPSGTASLRIDSRGVRAPKNFFLPPTRAFAKNFNFFKNKMMSKISTFSKNVRTFWCRKFVRPVNNFWGRKKFEVGKIFGRIFFEIFFDRKIYRKNTQIWQRFFLLLPGVLRTRDRFFRNRREKLSRSSWSFCELGTPIPMRPPTVNPTFLHGFAADLQISLDFTTKLGECSLF